MKKALSAAEFVVVWQQSKSVAEVAKRAGLTPRSASIRASTYRKRGVLLKKFVPTLIGRRPLDVAALNALALSATLNNQKEE